jgi:tRNA nucleotidyltransferase (CCA-adding enzyme)
MKVYQVGGGLRGEMLGLAVQDRDWVVVGADPAEMARRGFRPVGADFPVFLHPETHEEYALARTERKTGPGYRGFAFHAAPDVTLEQDLERRDLTINAMARGEDGVLVDPHGGAKDLRAGVLRHVSPAFAEDPVRILRVARFAARFGFAVAPETMALMRRMVDAGEADALVPERVWQELSRGLLEKSPSRMIAVLRECGALARVLPEVDRVFDRPEEPERLAARLEHAATRGYGLAVRYALLVIDLDPADTQALARRVNAPNDCSAARARAGARGGAQRGWRRGGARVPGRHPGRDPARAPHGDRRAAAAHRALARERRFPCCASATLSACCARGLWRASSRRRRPPRSSRRCRTSAC